MHDRGSGYYYGSYGLVRGYGKLCRTLKEADDSVFADQREQRKNGGTTDRNAVVVTPHDGACWWADEEDETTDTMVAVRTPDGKQARYSLQTIREAEERWQVSRIG